MKRAFLIAALILPLFVNAQKTRTKQDSLRYYQNELRMLWIKTNDSLRKSDQYLSIQHKIEKLRRRKMGTLDF